MMWHPCAALVERGDAERFAALMAAPVAARGPLAVLYAFNLEVARAPWVTKEPMIAEMRLQWWRDIVAEAAEGRPARAHEVAGPLSELIGQGRIDGTTLYLGSPQGELWARYDATAPIPALQVVAATGVWRAWREARFLQHSGDRCTI